MIYFALNSMVLLLLKHLFFFHHNADYCNLIYRTVFKIWTILKKPKTTRDRQKHTHPDVSLLITERKKPQLFSYLFCSSKVLDFTKLYDKQKIRSCTRLRHLNVFQRKMKNKSKTKPKQTNTLKTNSKNPQQNTNHIKQITLPKTPSKTSKIKANQVKPTNQPSKTNKIIRDNKRILHILEFVFNLCILNTGTLQTETIKPNVLFLNLQVNIAESFQKLELNWAIIEGTVHIVLV